MQMNTNPEIVLELYTTFDSGDFDRVKELLTENFAAQMVGMPADLNRDTFTTFGFRQQPIAII
jgi:ketosteroid isomerase-like protein